MQQGNIIDVFLARHVSGTYAHHQEHQTLSCIIWFSAPRFWMGGGLDSRCVGRVCGADVAVRCRTATSAPGVGPDPRFIVLLPRPQTVRTVSIMTYSLHKRLSR